MAEDIDRFRGKPSLPRIDESSNDLTHGMSVADLTTYMRFARIEAEIASLTRLTIANRNELGLLHQFITNPGMDFRIASSIADEFLAAHRASFIAAHRAFIAAHRASSNVTFTAGSVLPKNELELSRPVSESPKEELMEKSVEKLKQWLESLQDTKFSSLGDEELHELDSLRSNSLRNLYKNDLHTEERKNHQFFVEKTRSLMLDHLNGCIDELRSKVISQGIETDEDDREKMRLFFLKYHIKNNEPRDITELEKEFAGSRRKAESIASKIGLS